METTSVHGRREGDAPSPSSRWLNVDQWLVWAAVACALGLAWWTSQRGFEFLDTGCYFLEYKYPQDVTDTHTTYRLFARPFFLLVGEDIVSFRYVSWLLVWASAGVFAYGWKRHLDAIEPAQGARFPLLLTMGVALLASGANYTIKPTALTYNSLNFVAVCLALGLLFDGAARLMRAGPTAGWAGVLEIAGAAGVALVDVLVKPTTAAFTLGAIVLYAGIFPGIGLAAKKRLGLLAAIGAFGGLVAMIVVVGGLDAFWLRMRTLTGILENRAFMDELNTRTIREFGELGAFLSHDLRWAFSALGLSGVVLFLLRWKPRWQRPVATVAGASVLLLWLQSTYANGLWRGSHGLYFEGIVARLYLGAALLGAAAALVSVLVAASPEERSGPRWSPWLRALLWLILIVLPFAGAYGSTTSVYLNGAIYSLCWLSALFLSLGEISSRWAVRSRTVVSAAAVPLAFYAVAQLYHGQVVMPYMYPLPLTHHTVPTPVGNEGSVVLLDAPTSEVIAYTRKTLADHGFKPGDDIFCFFNVPGLVFAVGGRSPVAPWYFGRIYGGNPIEESQMQAAGEDRRRKAWLITQADVTVFRDHFLRGGVDFPDGYEEIGATKNPQSGLPLKIWKPRRAVP